MRIKEQLAEIGRNFAHSLRDFPLEAALGLSWFVLYVLQDKHVFAGHSDDWLLWLLPLYCLLYTAHCWCARSKWFHLLYGAVWLLWIPLACWRPDPSLSYSLYWASLVVSTALLLVGTRKLPDEDYGDYLLHRAKSLLVGLFITGVLMLLTALLVTSIRLLFELPISYKWTEYPLMFILLAVGPLLCCSLAGESYERPMARPILTRVVNYVLTPAILAYALILHGYLFKIVLQWRLPDGGVVAVVVPFLVLELVCTLLRLQTDRRMAQWYYAHVTAFSAFPIVLLWVASFRRFWEYGLTENRFYLLLSVIVLTLFFLMLLHPRTRRFQWMALVVAVVSAVFSFLPGIRARDFGIRSQQARLEAELPLVLEEGRFPKEIDYGLLANDSVKVQLYKRTYEAWDYLSDEMPPEQFQQLYGAYGEFDFRPWRLDADWDSMIESDDASVVVWELSEPLDVSDCRTLVPGSCYHYREDSLAAVFYRDDSRTDTLLYCPVYERLQEEDTVALHKLCYENAGYKAVFTLIKDRRASSGSVNFTTGSRYLFQK